MDLKALVQLTLVGSQFLKTDEPSSFAEARKDIRIWSSSYGGQVLKWEKIRAIVGDTDQMTVTYLLVSPDHGLLQDIEAIAQIYNPEGTWMNQHYDELIVEIGKMAWAEIEINASGRRWTFPEVYTDEIVTPGFLTFRVPRRR